MSSFVRIITEQSRRIASRSLKDAMHMETRFSRKKDGNGTIIKTVRSTIKKRLGPRHVWRLRFFGEYNACPNYFRLGEPLEIWKKESDPIGTPAPAETWSYCKTDPHSNQEARARPGWIPSISELSTTRESFLRSIIKSVKTNGIRRRPVFTNFEQRLDVEGAQSIAWGLRKKGAI